MRLPAAGREVPTRLQVVVEGEREIWIRDFGTLRLRTRQWHHRGLLIEQAGPIRFGLRVRANAEGLRFDTERCWLGWLPLPARVAPRVTANITARETGWSVDVQIAVPGLGLLARYTGEVTPEC